MVRRFPLFLLVYLPFTSSAQFGINVRHVFGQSETLDLQQIRQDGFQVSGEYHFRLKENRVEFHPGLGYRQTWKDNRYEGHLQGFDLDLNTSIYPFDFAGDCDCPTFSKDGNVIKKGFFLEFAPGASYQTLTRRRSTQDPPENTPIRSRNLVWKIGGAAGIDIGVSDHFTLTPMFSATWLSASDWAGLNRDGSTATLRDMAYLGAGLRITYTEDTKRRRK